MSEDDDDNNKTFFSEEDDDILNDVRNLFIQSEEDENEDEPIFLQEEEPKPPRVIFDSNLKKSPVIIEEPKTDKKSPPAPGKIIVEVKPKEKEEDKVIYKPPTPAKPKPKSDRCKSNSDCNSDSFCLTKTGKCVAKLTLGQAGCSADDQCQGKTTVCYSKTCKLLCNTKSEKNICDTQTGRECIETKGLKSLKAFDGIFNGICDKSKATLKKTENNVSGGGTSKSSIAILSISIVLAVVGAMVLFVYIRSYLRRRYRNTNPDMFLFNKLQKNANQSLSQQPSVDRLNERLSHAGGARFTRWAALSNENI